ncbi:MAG: DUF1015 domain-containing protein [Clostridia bacterium]|nr:DUF1015 domain-containing protein [Clostridia bacterium]
MAYIKPFPCIRPRNDMAEKIAALPYDVYNREEAKKEVMQHPDLFLKIDRAETQFPDDVDTYDDRVYQKAHDMLWDLIDEGVYLKDDQPCYYIYELTMNQRSQTGIVACASIDDYLSGVIMKHENTRADKQVDRIRHVDTCCAQTGPIFLAYRAIDQINQVVDRTKKSDAVYDFTTDDGIRHSVWIIDNQTDIQTVFEAFQKTNEIYIADGHHRCASAVEVGLKRRKEHPDYDGTEELNTILSVLFPDDQLMIMDYNRVVKDLNGYSTEQFLDKVREKYDVELSGSNPYSPSKKGTLGMYLNDQWYGLKIKAQYCSNDPVEGLDVSILQRELLEPVLNIKDPKTDKRIDFVGGIRGLSELERRVHTDCAVAFAMYPTSISELFAVADAKLLMPPKSTWFEPKLRSGIFIHAIEK